MNPYSLIQDKYYYFSNYLTHKTYFKYHGCDNVNFYSYPFKLMEDLNGFLKYKEIGILENIEYFNDLYEIFEADLSIIIDYLPNTNPDKKIYLRKQKINKLLNG